MAGKKNSVSKTKSRNSTAIPKDFRSDTAQPWFLNAVQSIASILAISSSVSTAKTVLTPLFGHVPTTLYLNKVAVGLIILFNFLPAVPTRRVTNISILAATSCLAPPTFHWLSTLTARFGNPTLGPILAYTPVLLLTTSSATNIIRNLLRSIPIPVSWKCGPGVKLITGVIMTVIVLQIQQLWSLLPYIRILNQPIVFLAPGWFVTLSELFVVLWKHAPSSVGRRPYGKFYRASFLSFPVIFTFAATLLTVIARPVRLFTTPYTDPSGRLRILSSTPSVTGHIVVAENYIHGFRFLRADHSLLGGVWIGNDKIIKMDNEIEVSRDKDGVKLGDSIYSTFMIQGAVVLQERENAQKNALVIGLGIGIVAQTFMQHGILTSVVEIDPAVYSAARDYFGLPKPYAVYLEDARRWVSRSADQGTDTYDIIVHDCFSGGGVPAHLFTTEFWENLKRILDPEGIVAVNFAGRIKSKASKAILATLSKSFAQCRVFHDFRSSLSEEQLSSEFINLVFFCTPSKQLTFREARKEDYLSSYLREHVLQEFPNREIPLDLIRGDLTSDNESTLVLTDDRNPLGAWQDEGALEHWRVMRKVLPAFIWETY